MKLLKRSKVKPVSHRERVYEELRRLILTGRIPPGTRLVESAIATEMGVSRTPVREALHNLDLEDLIHSIPRVGYFVSDMSDYDIEDLFATREAIEQLATKWAIEKLTDEELERLEENLQKTDRLLANGHLKKMIDLDTEFHEVICKASRSRRLYQISQILREHMLKFRMTCLHIPEIAKKARDGHFEILAAIKSKNLGRVEHSIRNHMDETKKDILDYMRRLREESL